MLPVKALSIRQPWAWAITTLGKDIENRDWRTRYRGPVLIHAGQGVKGEDVEGFLHTVAGDPALQARLDAAGGLRVDELRRQAGGIVGVATITGCVEASASPWFFGRFGFVLADASPLPFRACKGQLGFFTPRADGEPRPTAPAVPPRPAQTDLFA